MTTPNLALPELVAAQSQPHVPVNTALRRLDAVVQLSILEVLNDPPASSPSPPDGDSYIIGTAPTGEWAGRSGDIAFWAGNAWGYATPQLGWIAYNIDTGSHLTFIGGSPAAWVTFNPGGGGGGGSAAEARIFEDFLHGPSTTPYAGWDYVVNTGTVSLSAPVSGTDAAGIWILQTGTNINGYAAIYYGNGGSQAQVVPINGSIRIAARIRAIAPLSDNTTPSVLRIGLATTFLTNLATAAGIFIEVSNDGGSGDVPRFRGYSRDGSADLDATAYAGTVTDGQWYTVELVGAPDGTSFEAFLDGVSIGSFDTSSTDSYQLGVVHGKTGTGATSVQWDIDYYEFTQTLNRT